MSRADQRALLRVLGGRAVHTDDDAPTGVVEGRVHSIVAAGMKFTIPDYDSGKHVFGPAPWVRSLVEPAPGATGAASAGTAHTHPGTHDHEGSSPAGGDRCLVIFVGGGIDNPWVVGFWPS